MPQCGWLRSMGVCGFEPGDPPPQKIEEEMKGAPYRPRPDGRFLRRALSVDNEAVVPLGKIVPVEVTIDAVPGRMNET
jgi:hypothetical protein